ncbi:MAG: thioesterase family protein [Clostridia bacterium]|nr:thioesterase family protein [Clostridia bacterium]
MIEVGIKGKKAAKVTEEYTAAHLLSGLLPVFATPALVALMEYTCSDSVQSELGKGFGTVGALIDCRHLSPSPIGSTVTCESELVEIDNRRLVFKVRACDDFGEIGSGTHERFIIDNERFMLKVDEKQRMLENTKAEG